MRSSPRRERRAPNRWALRDRDCQAGFGKIRLAPPPLEFQALSIPPGATPTTLVSLPEASNCGLKVVPPTPVTWGLAAISLALRVVPVTQVLLVAVVRETCRAPVARADEYRLALAGGLCEQRIQSGVDEDEEPQKMELMLIAPQVLSVTLLWIEV